MRQRRAPSSSPRFPRRIRRHLLSLRNLQVAMTVTNVLAASRAFTNSAEEATVPKPSPGSETRAAPPKGVRLFQFFILLNKKAALHQEPPRPKMLFIVQRCQELYLQQRLLKDLIQILTYCSPSLLVIVFCGAPTYVIISISVRDISL